MLFFFLSKIKKKPFIRFNMKKNGDLEKDAFASELTSLNGITWTKIKIKILKKHEN